MSPQQRHLWRLQLGSTPFLAKCQIAITGDLDRQALVTGFNRLVGQFEILRTSLQRIPGMPAPLQVIAEEPMVKVNELEWTGCDEEERQQRTDQLYAALDQVPIDCEQGPLLHIELATLEPARFLLFLRAPALILDTASLYQVMRQCASLCGEDPGTDEIMQFADISQWQNEMLEDEESEDGRNFWRNRWESTPTPTPLSLETPIEEPEEFRVNSIRETLSAELTAGLTSCAQAQGILAGDILLACWQVLLWRHSGNADTIVGVHCDGRHYEELAEAIGPLEKYVPLRWHLDKAIPFATQAIEVGRERQQLASWQEYFDWAAMAPEGEHAAEGSLPYCFSFQEAPPPVSTGNLHFSLTRFFVHGEPFKLRLSCVHEGATVSASLDYDSHAFGDETVAILIRQWRTLVEQAVADMSRPLGRLSGVGQEERHRLLREWNETPARQDSTLIHQLFEVNAEQRPVQTAVHYLSRESEGAEAGEETEKLLSYGEINQSANRLAHHLRGQGIGLESRVGLSINRSPEMVIGLLAILKAGGAFVFLDPTYPPERLAYIVADAKISHLLTTADLRDFFQPELLTCVCLDADWPEIEKQPKSNLNLTIAPENTAYVIYTSGSTGLPKGVLVTHRGITNLAEQQTASFELDNQSRVLQFASLNFDASVFEIIMPWQTAATLCIAPKPELMPGGPLEQMLKRLAVSHITLPPSALAACDPTGLETLRHLIVAGEACSLPTYQKWRKGRAFYNAYGPAETTVCATIKNASQPCSRLTIGRPLAHTQAYVLDDRYELAPIGVAGHLALGGINLARGYLDKPGLTASRFTPHPFATQPGQRLYQTGDLARFLPDSELDFLGREDHQVKIRGHRIELGEIEAALASHPDVREAAVITSFKSAHGVTLDEKRLVGFVRTAEPDQDGERTTAGSLRQYLGQKLPEYMVPSLIQFLAEMPLTPSGKIDRQALTSPELLKQLEKSYVAPRNPGEETLAGIWADVLKLERVGIQDSFFEIGGHSLLAMQVITRVRTQFGVELSMRTLFEAPTIPELLGKIEEQKLGDRLVIDDDAQGEAGNDMEELSL